MFEQIELKSLLCNDCVAATEAEEEAKEEEEEQDVSLFNLFDWSYIGTWINRCSSSPLRVVISVV